MIVTCPHCAKRYMLDDALLPKEGRQVRCIACNHVWRQTPEVSSYQNNLPFIVLNDEAPRAYPSARNKSSGKLWFFFCIILIFSISFLIFGRNLIVPFCPPLERYYELLGLPVSLVGSGLTISNATSHIHQEGPLEKIIVSGDLVNTSNQVRPIPPLKIMLVGDISHPKCMKTIKDRDCILDHWNHRLSEKSLLPGEQIHFETASRPIIEGISHISIEF